MSNSKSLVLDSIRRVEEEAEKLWDQLLITEEVAVKLVNNVKKEGKAFITESRSGYVEAVGDAMVIENYVVEIKERLIALLTDLERLYEKIKRY